MNTTLTICFAIVLALPHIHAQDAPQAYELYTGEGKSTKYKKLLKACQEADFIFFGEQHNNPISHWLMLELFKELQPESEDAVAPPTGGY